MGSIPIIPICYKMIFRRGLIKQNKKFVKKKINKSKITAVRFFKKHKLKKK